MSKSLGWPITSFYNLWMGLTQWWQSNMVAWILTVNMAAAEEQQPFESALKSTVKEAVKQQQPWEPCLSHPLAISNTWIKSSFVKRVTHQWQTFVWTPGKANIISQKHWCCLHFSKILVECLSLLIIVKWTLIMFRVQLLCFFVLFCFCFFC